MPGFPSYCAGSLLIIASSTTSCRCPRIGRCVFLHAYPGTPPNQVRLRYGPSTSYHFLQTPPLASDALVNRILFPVDGARSLTSSDWVCQLRWANKKPPAVEVATTGGVENVTTLRLSRLIELGPVQCWPGKKKARGRCGLRRQGRLPNSRTQSLPQRFRCPVSGYLPRRELGDHPPTCQQR